MLPTQEDDLDRMVSFPYEYTLENEQLAETLLEDEFPFGARPPGGCHVLVLESVSR